MGKVNDTYHRTDLIPGDPPFKSAQYRAGTKKTESNSLKLIRSLKLEILSRLICYWAAFMLPAPNKDEKLRLCDDYRQVNNITGRDSYPFPRMDEFIDSLRDGTVFSFLTIIGDTGMCQSITKANINVFRLSFWTIPKRPHAVWNAQCPSNIPTRPGYYPD